MHRQEPSASSAAGAPSEAQGREIAFGCFNWLAGFDLALHG